MRVLLFGKDGQVGAALSQLLTGGDVVALGRSDVDLMQPGAAAGAIRQIRPDVVINAAAWTAVDLAESQPAASHRINAAAVAEMAGAIRAGWFISYSTDYVFDGEKIGAYVETDTPRPLNVYGHTKLWGEAAIAAVGRRHLVFRTSWVHAPNHANFVTTILRLAIERDRLSVVDDQIGAPTSAALVAQVTGRALNRIAAGRPMESGLYHLTAAGRTNWFDYARLVLRCAYENGAQLRCGEDSVMRTSSDQYRQLARRPRNSQLSTAKLGAALEITFPDWRMAVMETVRASLSSEAACLSA